MMNKEIAIINGKEIDVTTVMDKTVQYTPSRELSDSVIDGCKELLDKYQEDKLHDGYGLRKMFKPDSGMFWQSNGWIISAMEKHPFYNGNLQIVLRDQDMSRYIELDTVSEFFSYAINWIEDQGTFVDMEGNEITPEERCELMDCYVKAKRIALRQYDNTSYYTKEWKISRKAIARLDNLYDFYYYQEAKFTNENLYAKRAFRILRDYIVHTQNQFVDQTTVERLHEWAENYNVKVRFGEGQKVSRVVGKIAKMCGLNRHVDIRTETWTAHGELCSRTADKGWNYQYAQFCDAVNPIELKGTFVISDHPVDFLGMSIGHKWASCQTADKENIRRLDNGYHGMYFGGTESEMLDDSTIVTYYLPAEFEGDHPEFEDKLKRCLFAIGEDKLVQFRVYPDGRDGGDNSLPATMRGIVQKVVSEIFNVPNYWDLSKGTSACGEATITRGVHYRDYLCYEDCNVSYMKRIDGYKNVKKIIIGRNPICPECGIEHRYEENVFCETCSNGGYICSACGDHIYDPDDVYWIGDEPYCRDCVLYCEECGEYFLASDERETSDDRCICPDCIDYHYTYSYNRGDYVPDGRAIETEEGHIFDDELDYDEFGICCECGAYHDLDYINYDEETDDYYCDECYEKLLASRKNEE